MTIHQRHIARLNGNTETHISVLSALVILSLKIVWC
jgi:hypothetical protein